MQKKFNPKVNFDLINQVFSKDFFFAKLQKMEYQINTKDDLLNFVESHDLTAGMINEILLKTKIGGIFLKDHSPEENAEFLREFFRNDCYGIFVDPPDLGVVKKVENGNF